MQKKLLAAAILAAVAGQAAATEVYSDDTTSVSIGGYLSMKTVTTDSDTTLENDSSRINFGFAHKLNEDITAIAKSEWAFDDEDDFTARLNYVGVNTSHGDVVLGKQWSVYSDVAGWTDVWAMNGGDVEGMYAGRSGDGGEHGTGRADDAIAYRNSFGGLNVGAQFQFRDTGESGNGRDFTRKNGYQAAASYDFDFGLSVGAAYNETDFGNVGSHDGKGRKAKATIGAIKYTRDALYVAATYGEYKNHVNVDSYIGGGTPDVAGLEFNEKVEGQALYVSYKLTDSVKLESAFQQMESKDKGDKAELKNTMVGAVYTVGPMQFAAQYIWDDSTFDNGKSKKDVLQDDETYKTKRIDDKVMLQARYYF